MSLLSVSVFSEYLLLLFKAFLEWRYLKVEGDSGGFGLYILAQTGFVKNGSDLKCLHASVGENIEVYEYQKETFFLFLFYGCSVRGSN